jgi:GAF domain-containing protein
MKSKSDDGKAALERENAELRRQLDESLAQQTAAAEVLQVINSSPGDLAPVFEAILEKAVRLCQASFGILWNFDGDLASAGALHQVPQAYAALCREPFRPSRESGPARMIRGEDTLAIVDVRDSPGYRDGDPLTRAIADLAGARSIVIAPLRRDTGPLGAITLYRQEVRPFTDKQIALLESFAAQAVIAMENARLLTATREALDQQTATAEVLQVINSSPGDIVPVFDAMLEKAVRLSEADHGVIWTQDGERYRAAALRDVPEKLAEFLRGASLPLGPGTFVGRVMRERSPLHIADTTLEEPYRQGVPIAVAGVELGGARTILTVPLLKGDALVGIFQLTRREVRPFTDKQITLMQNFAVQAVIAMENARLITETREALEQQTATSEVLQIINSSPGDLAPVFEALLDKALRLCEASFGYLLTYDGEGFQSAADRGHPAFAAWVRAQGRIMPEPGTGNSRIASGERVIHIADVVNDPEYQGGAAMRRAVVEIGGFRTVLTVALRKDEALLGVIHVYRQEVRPFSDRQIALLQNFAAQAVIAMENARLINETREALDQQTATAEVLGVINSSPGDLTPVFEAMLERALRLCGAAFGSLVSYDGEVFQHVAQRNLPQELVGRFGLPLRAQEGSLLHRLIDGENLVQIEDIAASSLPSSLGGRAALAAAGARAMLWVALRREDTLLGAINIYRTETRPFTDKEVSLLQNFAAQAVIAMENARLLEETQQRTADLQESLEYQTATSDVLKVISRSTFNLQPVLDFVCETAARLCQVQSASIFRLGGDGMYRWATGFGLTPGYRAIEEAVEIAPGRDTLVGRAALTRKTVHIVDGLADLEYGAKDDLRVSEHRALLGVPLLRDSVVLGVICLARQEVGAFSDKQIELVATFADQAVIAMENARLITETREALEQQTATAEVLGVINSSPGDLQPVFDAILEKAHLLCGVACGSLELYDGKDFRAVATIGFSDTFTDLVRQGYSALEAPDTRALVEGARYAHILDLAETDAVMTQHAAELEGHRTLLCVPLRREGQLLGMIASTRNEVRAFTNKEIELLENFAAQAVIAIENARLLGELRQRTEEVAELNRGLEARVAEQVDELGRVGRLKRFLAPQLAELIVSQGDEKILESHRREIVVVFCDLRGYTAFTETAEPEEVLDFLREYHGALGPLVAQFEGTLDQFSGDGIMVFFNDPVPIPDPAERAVKMAMAMRESASALTATWRRRGRELGFGAGIAQGYATLGQIGFSERSGYTAIGTVCNVAARLCAEAKDGQILITQRVAAGLDSDIALEDRGPLPLKGITQPVVALNVTPPGAGAGRLRLIEP